MKILFWDIDGFVLYYKRLETGSFAWVDDVESGANNEILSSEFALLLAGINPSDLRRSKLRSNRYKRLPETSLV